MTDILKESLIIVKINGCPNSQSIIEALKVINDKSLPLAAKESAFAFLEGKVQ